MLKTIPWAKQISNPISNLLAGLLAPGAEKTQKITKKNVEKFEKNEKVFGVKLLKSNSITTESYAVTFYQTV